MMRMLIAGLILALIARPAWATPWTQNVDSPPEMVDPLIVTDKCPGDVGWPTNADMAGRDVKIVFPTDRDCTLIGTGSGNTVTSAFFLGGTQSNPARNMWLIGGSTPAPPPRPQTDPNTAGWPNGWTIRYLKGEFYWEGPYIDMGCTCRDAIAIASVGYYEGGKTLTGDQPLEKTPKIKIVNSILQDPLQCGGNGAVHGDIIHSQGSGTRPQVKLQNVVYRHGFQGLFLDAGSNQPVGAGASRIEFDHVVARKRGPDCTRIPTTGTNYSLAWFVAPRDGLWFNKSYFDYSQYGSYTSYSTAPAQSGFDSSGCATYAASAGVKTAGWCKGPAPEGDPATPAMVGRNYSRAAFTGGTVTPPPPTASAGKSRIFTKSGLAALGAALARRFEGAGTGDNIVAYGYRESAKATPPGSADLCTSSGVSWGGDIAQDVIYITSSLDKAADLDVSIGTAPPVRVSLPANQAENGQQTTIPMAGKVGTVRFALSRDGTTLHEWEAALPLASAPAQRSVSTYFGAEAIPPEGQQSRAWWTPVALDRPEGSAGETTAFTVRLSRDSAVDTMTARCRVVAGTASASDFSGGVLPDINLTLPPGTLTSDAAAVVRGDSEIEPDETFSFVCDSISPATYRAPATTTFDAVIRNDDVAKPGARFDIRAVSPTVTEGTGGVNTPVQLEITRSGVTTGTDTVDLCQIPASTENAASPNDVETWTAEIVSFPPSTTSIIREPKIVADAVHEPNEQLAYQLKYPSAGAIVGNGTAVVTIVDDDAAFASASRINAGATDVYTDTAGNVWAPDSGSGGSTATNAFTFTGTTDQTIYRSYRYGPSTYSLTVDPGAYDIIGMFSEPDTANDNINCSGADPDDTSDDIPGRRLMVATVSATGGDTTTSSVIDPYCVAGFRAAYEAPIGRVNAPQGKIDIALRSAPGSQAVPLINGLSAVRVIDTTPAAPQEWLNVGAPADSRYTDAAGKTWRGMPPAMATGCTSVVDTTSPPIDGTERDQLYWSRCQGSDMSFSVPVVEAGSAKSVTLLFAEPTAGPGARVVDVYINGALQIANLDVSAAAGGARVALNRVVSPVTVGSDGTVRVRVVAKTSAPAIINGIAITEPLMAQHEFQISLGWKQTRKINKRDLIRLVSPTLLSPAGRPIVIRGIDTSSSSVYACHGTCASTATRGVQPDTDATNGMTQIQISAVDPANPSTSEFPALGRGERVDDSFTVRAVELLPDGTTGAEAILTVRVAVRRER